VKELEVRNDQRGDDQRPQQQRQPVQAQPIGECVQARRQRSSAKDGHPQHCRHHSPQQKEKTQPEGVSGRQQESAATARCVAEAEHRRRPGDDRHLRRESQR
jgi:hypothetical protein